MNNGSVVFVCVNSCTSVFVRTILSLDLDRERTFFESGDILDGYHFFKGLFEG